MNKQEAIQWLKLILLMLGVIAVGMVAINQTLGSFYKAELLMKPCDLCLKLNPNIELCPKMPDLNNFTGIKIIK